MSPDSGFRSATTRLHVVVERDVRARHKLDAGDRRAALKQVRDPGVLEVVGRDQLAALDPELNHAIARERAQWFLRRRGCAEAELEELAGRVAAAICVPTTALLSAHKLLGEDLTALSRQFSA